MLNRWRGNSEFNLEASVTTQKDDDKPDPGRRDFMVLAGSTFAGVGAAASLWPFIDQMNPDAGAQALASIEVDLSSVSVGQAITVLWRGKPVFIRHRQADEIAAAKAVAVDDLPDDKARNEDLPANDSALDANRVKEGHENWLVLVGICTHLGCIPRGKGATGQTGGEYGGWFCPCHGSHYDTSGRIRKGPAPRNLDVPPYKFVSDNKIKIG